MKRTLLRILMLMMPSMMMAEGNALYISDNKQVEDSWSWCFSPELGLQVKRITTCYDCRLVSEKGMSADVQRILSMANMSVEKPDVVFLQLGCNDEADSEESFKAYEQTLFDYPYGRVQNSKGANPRTKNIAVSKEDTQISNANFAGSLYRIVKFIRESSPDTRIFFLSPMPYGKTLSPDEMGRISQLKAVANMLCIPFADNIDMVKAYDFIWTKRKPKLGKMLLIGDSYCFTRKWTAQLEQIAEVSLTNLGKTSATLKEKTNGNTNTLGNQLRSIPKGYTPDVILLEGGINDEADQQRFVDKYDECIRDVKRTTFAGALAYIVKNLRERFPQAKIFVVTPGGLYYGHTDHPFDFIVKSDQIRKAANLLGLPTIDWDREGRLSFVFNNSKGTGNGSASKPYIYNVPTRETGDLLHPNEVGGRYLAENVVKEVSTLWK